ncbi:hypothetical protein [Paucimonas lemoignei]|uniref:hypothetical protein n=1 Tax=Paucimonas lemoignei TaxID=29443 RepID=UPI00104C8023|nr:hypothetical protein [Paucimonas lemoignei]
MNNLKFPAHNEAIISKTLKKYGFQTFFAQKQYNLPKQQTFGLPSQSHPWVTSRVAFFID